MNSRESGPDAKVDRTVLDDGIKFPEEILILIVTIFVTLKKEKKETSSIERDEGVCAT